MNKLSTIAGVVVDASGRPVPDATVTVVESTSPVPELALLTDDAGRFSLRLPSGRFTLEAHGPNDTKGRQTVEVSGAEVRTRIELR